MSVTKNVLIENEKIRVVQFLWSKPITIASLEERWVIENALDEAICEYVPSSNYILLSAHKNPLLRLLGRVIILNSPFEYAELEDG